jgi:hypothetical protein
MIAVLGDTSSGKSSLLSSLSGIPLPAASSLTTKCPIQLQVEPKSFHEENENENDNDAIHPKKIYKRATVRIQWKIYSSSSGNNPNGSPRERKRVLERDRPPVFEPRIITMEEESNVHEDNQETFSETQTSSSSASSFTKTTTNEAQWDAALIQVIKDAQDIILQYRYPCRVAPDVISVHVQGPHIAYPLTLVDLPGLVQYQPTTLTMALDDDDDDDDDKHPPHQFYHDAEEDDDEGSDNDSVSATIEEKKHDKSTTSTTTSKRPSTTAPSSITDNTTTSNNLLQEVEQVMQGYFANERCLLLAVLSSGVNLHNSKVLSMIQKVDPQSMRTVPVLTKPDLIDPGAEGDVVQLLQPSSLMSTTTTTTRTSRISGGDTSPVFRHGFFLVKNRGQAQLDQKVSVSQALQDEAKYFATTHPWASLSDSIRQTRLGVPNLLQKLSQLQWSMTRATLPQVIQEIQTKRATCQELLDGMGTLYTTRTEQRRYYQSILQDLWMQLHASLSGRGLVGGGGRLRSRRSSNVARGSGRGRTLQDKQSVDQPPTFTRTTTNNTTINEQTTTPRRNKKLQHHLAAAQLHHACADFCQAIRSGSLATIQTLVEGAQVLVSSPNSVGGEDVRGQIVHLDEIHGYACVDCLSTKDHTTDVLFDVIGCTARGGRIVSALSMATTVHHRNPNVVDVIHHGHSGGSNSSNRHSQNQHPRGHRPANGTGHHAIETHDDEEYTDEEPEEDRLEEDEVWSDGQHVYIARQYPLVDRLRQLPLKRIRTDPTWLLDKIAQYRTDDLACFINVDIFKHIVGEFVEQDWTPPCFQLVETTRQIVMSTLDECLNETLILHGVVTDDNDNGQADDNDTSRCRFPRLQQALYDACHEVANELLATATTQLEAHLELEQSYPYTQDDVLLNTIAQSRYETLKRDLELQLRLDQEGVVLDTHAIQTILDRVFDKHRSPSSSSMSSTAPGMEASSSLSSTPLTMSSGSRGGGGAAMYLAEELELILSCYGKVATQRVLDRTPMICWQVCRSLKPKLEQALGCVTDETLQEFLWESPATLSKMETTTAQLQELDKALKRIGVLQGLPSS